MIDHRATASGAITRRTALRAVPGLVGTVVGLSAAARAQSETETTGQAQITTTVVIPELGPPFEGNYTGQFVIFTDPTPNNEVSPAIIAECDSVDWTPEQTNGYEVLIVDRLSDDPQGVSVQAFVDGTQPRVDVGNGFIINRTQACPRGYLMLELEDVPIQTFNPRYGTEDDGLVGESPGPTISPTDDQGGTEAPGQPGFGAAAAMVSVGVAMWLRRLLTRA